MKSKLHDFQMKSKNFLPNFKHLKSNRENPFKSDFITLSIIKNDNNPYFPFCSDIRLNNIRRTPSPSRLTNIKTVNSVIPDNNSRPKISLFNPNIQSKFEGK